MEIFNNLVQMAYSHYCMSRGVGRITSMSDSVRIVLELAPVTEINSEAHSRILARVKLLVQGTDVGDIKSQHA